MGEADMYMDSDNSSLEYVPGVEYEDYGSCSIGHFTMGQLDGTAEDDNTDDDVSSDEGESQRKTPRLHTHQRTLTTSLTWWWNRPLKTYMKSVPEVANTQTAGRMNAS